MHVGFFAYSKEEELLPEGFHYAYDGLELEC